MIFLDTNVVSEIMRPEPDARVVAWLKANEWQIRIPSVVIAEIAFGIERIRPAERAPRLARALESIIARYRRRIMPFDKACAIIYGRIMGEAVRTGRALEAPDAMIAATALNQKALLATRNSADFLFLRIDLINPWG